MRRINYHTHPRAPPAAAGQSYPRAQQQQQQQQPYGQSYPRAQQQQPYGQAYPQQQQQQPYGYAATGSQQQQQQQQYGAQMQYPRAPPQVGSSYASQAAKWKQGFSGKASSGQVDREIAFVNDLCSAKGTSSFPPRDTLSKFLTAMPCLDSQYVCDLLHNKLDDRVWQVKAKTLTVLDSLLQQDDGQVTRYFSPLFNVFENLSRNPKRPVSSRALKICQVLQTATPLPEPPVAVPAPIQDDSVQFIDLNSPEGPSSFDFVDHPSPATVDVESPKVSALSFISAPDEHSAPPTIDVFDFTATEPVEDAVVEEQPSSESDRIHSAFEGLSFADTDSQLPEQMTLTSDPTFSADQTTDIPIEIELPPGPLGIVLDTRMEDMAVIERFILLPNGKSGLLALHPALCPGCYLSKINDKDVSSLALPEIGQELARTTGINRTLVFKKKMANGVTVDPSDPTRRYQPPPQEEPIGQDKSASLMDQLQVFETQMNEIDNAITEACTSQDKSYLAQLHGRLEKLEREGIDAVILGPSNENPNLIPVKEKRSELIRRSEAMMGRIRQLSEEIQVEEAPQSPQGSGFSFLGAAESPKAAETNDSAFSFMT